MTIESGVESSIGTMSAADRPERGSVVLLALVCVVIGGFMVVPLLRYAAGVSRLHRIESAQMARAEAVKGALRLALAVPRDLYAACSESGLHLEVALASAGLDVPVSTTCTTMADATEMGATDVRVGLAVVAAGASPPLPGTVGETYPGSGSTSTSAWFADVSTMSEGGKIWLPELAAYPLHHPSSTGYEMPAGSSPCTVFFPGTYSEPVVLDSPTPVYFTSGVYYFEDVVEVRGNTQVVVGGGAVAGCTTDQDAAYNAIGAPRRHNISGFGATFVLGAEGRILVDGDDPGAAPSMQFNTRLVADTDVGGQSSKGVSIVSVNGVAAESGSRDLEIAGLLTVPRSLASGTPATDAVDVGYVPSTLTPRAEPLEPATAIITVAGGAAASVWVPGYVCVPQGVISVSASPGGSSVQMVGGVLAAQVLVGDPVPSTFALGLVNRVVQKTFKIVAVSETSSPRIRGTALVQLNDYGEFVVNSWEIRNIG